MNLFSKRSRRWYKSVLGMSLSLVTPWLIDYAYRKLYSSEDADPELHRVPTPDKVKVGLWHYTPNGNGSEPVLFVHGLGANHRNMALNKENGLVQYMVGKGYDCWAVDLRGRGESETPEGSWCFDDYAKKDLPATLDYVLEQTGYDKLHWVGHSMGGMLYYAVAGALHHQNKIASATTMASPFGMQEPLMVNRLALSLNRMARKAENMPLARFFDVHLKDLPSWLKKFDVPIHKLPQAYIIRWIGFFLILFKRFLPQDFILAYMNPNQVDDATIRKGVNEVVERMSYGELLQFADWVLNDRWTDENQVIDYAKGVPNIRVPTLMIGGAEDRMTPAHHLKWGFKALDTDDKKFVLAGEDTGFEDDYAHVDIVLGKNARDEIFPIIYDWIRKHPIRVDTPEEPVESANPEYP